MDNTNQEIIKLFQELQYEIVFNRYIAIGYAKICYSNDDLSVYWNYAFTNQLLTDEQLQVIEQEFKELERTSTIYFEQRDELYDLVTFLEKHNYKKSYEDSWLFFEDKEIDTARFDQVKKVENEAELEVFLDTFDKCYQKDDPQNPYGSIEGYIDSARNGWKNNHDEKLEYFIGYKEKKPVAVSALTSYEELGYIANVGSLKEVRGEGFGKLVTLYCVQQSMDKGNKYHFLATEEGTYPNEFYHRIGFKKTFSTLGYSKDQSLS